MLEEFKLKIVVLSMFGESIGLLTEVLQNAKVLIEVIYLEILLSCHEYVVTLALACG